MVVEDPRGGKDGDDGGDDDVGQRRCEIGWLMQVDRLSLQLVLFPSDMIVL